MISRIKSLLIIYLLFATNVISDMAINNIFINSKIIEIEKDTNKISFEGDVNIKSVEFTINADNASYDNLKKIIEQGIKNNFIEEFGRFNPPRYRGYKSMRNFLSNLTFNLNIKQNNTIIDLKPNKKQITALNEKTKTWQSFDGVISTIPSPQNYDLMENFPKLRKTLVTSSYDSCIAFMFSINKRP